MHVQCQRAWASLHCLAFTHTYVPCFSTMGVKKQPRRDLVTWGELLDRSPVHHRTHNKILYITGRKLEGSSMATLHQSEVVYLAGGNRGRREGPRRVHQRSLHLHHRGGRAAGRGNLLGRGSEPGWRGHRRYKRESCG